MTSETDLHKLKEEYLKKKRVGMDYTLIRKELHDKGVIDKDVKKIVQEIDNIILKEELDKTDKSTTNKMRIWGWLFTITGVIFTLGRYTDIAFFQRNYLLSYGGLIIGLTLLFYGYLKKKKSRNKETDPFSIFKKQKD